MTVASDKRPHCKSKNNDKRKNAYYFLLHKHLRCGENANDLYSLLYNFAHLLSISDFLYFDKKIDILSLYFEQIAIFWQKERAAKTSREKSGSFKRKNNRELI